jgi:2-polyprenyl-3-methyl-5-hydroxy-6-metoxy-1,4-benzoquinol methylase
METAMESAQTPISPDQSLRNRMREFYETSEAYKGLLNQHNHAYLKSYVDLVDLHTPPDEYTLDLGCGNGISSKMLHDRGRNVVGVDISPLFLKETKKWENDSLKYRVGDALNLDFESGQFGVVCSNELIEHTPDVETTLLEMIRVTRKGGRIVVAGPNLCSPIMPLLDFVQMVFGGNGRPIWAETKQQALQNALKNTNLYFTKRFGQLPQFLYREPDLEDQIIGGDADSTYIASPIDLEKFFRQHSLRIKKLCVGFGFKGKIMATFFPRTSLYISMVAEK